MQPEQVKIQIPTHISPEQIRDLANVFKRLARGQYKAAQIYREGDTPCGIEAVRAENSAAAWMEIIEGLRKYCPVGEVIIPGPHLDMRHIRYWYRGIAKGIELITREIDLERYVETPNMAENIARRNQKKTLRHMEMVLDRAMEGTL